MRLFLFTLFFSLTSHALAVEIQRPAVADCVDLYGGLIRTGRIPGVGDNLYLLAEKEGLRDFTSIDELKLGQFNVENLYNYLEKYEIDPVTGVKNITRPAKPKPEWRLKLLQRAMEEADNDIMVWQEVDDLEAAKNFIDERLGGKYRVILIDGTGGSDQNMEVALLVKKDLPFDLEMQSHKEVTYFNRRTQKREGLQSRDLVVTNFRKAGAPADSKPLFTLMASHFRSMRPKPADPRRSVKKRTLQYHHAVEVKKSEEAKHPGKPIFLVADFNSNLRQTPQSQRAVEANMLFNRDQGGFTDAFDLGSSVLPPEDRITHSFHPTPAFPQYTQLDGILLNRAAAKGDIVQKTRIIPFRKDDGSVYPPATTQLEREKQGSDHQMVQTVINFKKLRKLTE